MKKIILLLFLASGSLFAENLFDNSTMDSAGGWKGTRKFIDDAGNRVISVEGNRNRIVGFTQDVATRGMKELVLSFRYKTSDYKGGWLEVRGKNQSAGGSYYQMYLKADGQWQKQSYKFHDFGKNNQTTFSITLKKGEGTVFFDDVTLEATKE